MRRPTLAVLVAALFLAVSIPTAQAQQQEPPKEKKKPRKVWTEEDLAGLGGRINVVGVEAPPPAPPGQPAAPAGQAPADGSAIWEELDMLTQQRQVAQEQLDLNRRHLESMSARLNEETDPLTIEELLQGRNAKEEEVLRLEEELAQLNAQVAELEKQTRGRKRPAKTRAKAETPVKQRTPPVAEGEEPAEPAPPEGPPQEEPPAEEPPPPPPPAL